MKKSFLVEEFFVPVLYSQNQNEKSNLEPVLDDLAYWAENLLHLACFSEIVRLESAEVFTDDAKFIIKQSELMFSDKVSTWIFSFSIQCCNATTHKKKVLVRQFFAQWKFVTHEDLLIALSSYETREGN